MPTSAWAYGLATFAGTEGEAPAGARVLDTWYPTPTLGRADDDPVAHEAPAELARLEGVDEARGRLRPIVRLSTRSADGPWRSAIPAGSRREGKQWVFELPEGGPEPLLKALIDGGAGIETLAIERPGLHDAFVAIAPPLEHAQPSPSSCDSPSPSAATRPMS